jgi:hypothetical protein
MKVVNPPTIRLCSTSSSLNLSSALVIVLISSPRLLCAVSVSSFRSSFCLLSFSMMIMLRVSLVAVREEVSSRIYSYLVCWNFSMSDILMLLSVYFLLRAVSYSARLRTSLSSFLLRVSISFFRAASSLSTRSFILLFWVLRSALASSMACLSSAFVLSCPPHFL